MKINTKIIKSAGLVITLGVLSVIGLFYNERGAKAQLPSTTPLNVQVAVSKGAAAPGNNGSANFLVIVTNKATGLPIAGLVQSDFFIGNYYLVPGQTCGFGNHIVSFYSYSNGTYMIQVNLGGTVPSCQSPTWVNGQYLALVTVNSTLFGKGQEPVTLFVQ